MAFLLTGLSAPAQADLIVEVQDSTAAAGGTGAFDVMLHDTGGTFNVSGFQVQLSVPGGSGIQFTSVDTSTSTPYIFGTLQSPPLSFDLFPNTTFTASDSDFTPPFFTTLFAGDIFGLVHVNYSVASGTPASDVLVSIVPAGTMLFDDNTPIPNPIAYTPVNGTIHLRGVPEPSAMLLMAIGGAALLAHRRRRAAPARRPDRPPGLDTPPREIQDRRAICAMRAATSRPGQTPKNHAGGARSRRGGGGTMSVAKGIRRRTFLARLSGLGTAGLFALGAIGVRPSVARGAAPARKASPAEFALSARTRVRLDKVTVAEFSPFVGDVFRVYNDPKRFAEVRLVGGKSLQAAPRQDAAHGLAAGPGHARIARQAPPRPPFSLLFAGDGEHPFPQETYLLKHPEIGVFPLFLVPIGPGGGPAIYEATFG